LVALRPHHGGNLAWAAAQANCSIEEILDFSASINPLGPPRSAIAALTENLSQLHAYPDPSYRSLCQSLAQFHGLDPDWILPGNGAAELLTWAARDLVAAAEPTWVLAPGFRDYGRALAAFGGTGRSLLLPVCADRADPLAANRDHPAADGCDQRPSAPYSSKPSSPSPSNPPPWTTPQQPLPLPPEPGPFLVNTPHNPTGLLLDCQPLRSWLETGALVVVDEAFLDFLPQGDRHSCIPWLTQFPNLVVIRSLTKFYSLPGLRLGYAVGHPDRLRRWQQWRDPWSVNSLAAAVGTVVVQDRDFQTKTWAWLPPARDRLFQGLQSVPGLVPYPGAVNFLLVRFEAEARVARSVLDLQAKLLRQHRILIRDCLSFPELGDRFFRVAVRTDSDNQRLITALNAITTDSPTEQQD